jgi:DNA-directed RNA polymerase beta subunit
MPKRGKKIYFDVVHAAYLYAKCRVADKMTQKEAYLLISEECGMKPGTLNVRANREGWEKKLSILMPCLLALIPTSTTAMEVIDHERKEFLAMARKARERWHELMDYHTSQFKKAVENENPILASEHGKEISNLMRMARTTQEIAGHATCDSGASTAPDTAGMPTQQNFYKIVFPKESSQPRIPQPLPKTLEVKTEAA